MTSYHQVCSTEDEIELSTMIATLSFEDDNFFQNSSGAPDDVILSTPISNKHFPLLPYKNQIIRSIYGTRRRFVAMVLVAVVTVIFCATTLLPSSKPHISTYEKIPGTEIALYGQEDSTITDMAMSANGEYIVVAVDLDDECGEGYVQVWKVESDRQREPDKIELQGEKATHGQQKFSFKSPQVSISTDGSRIAVSARIGERNCHDTNGAGLVDVYEWSSSSQGWEQLGQSLIENEECHFYSNANGMAMSDDGTIVVVGCPAYLDRHAGSMGHVFAFQWTGSEWNRLGPDLAREGEFGQSIALAVLNEGDRSTVRIVVGCRNEVYDPLLARVFDLQENRWQEIGELQASILDPDYEDRTSDVAISKDGLRIVVSSHGTRDHFYDFIDVEIGFYGGGWHRVYTWTGSNWMSLPTSEFADLNRYYQDYTRGSTSISADGRQIAFGEMDSRLVRIFQWRDDGESKNNPIETYISSEDGLFGEYTAMSADSSRMAVSYLKCEDETYHCERMLWIQTFERKRDPSFVLGGG